jgi:hypothetical protein
MNSTEVYNAFPQRSSVVRMKRVKRVRERREDGGRAEIFIDYKNNNVYRFRRTPIRLAFHKHSVPDIIKREGTWRIAGERSIMLASHPRKD